MGNIREILVLHHTHTDIGFTHPQPVLWELENRFIDMALDLCDRSEDWPEPSRLRWTCETTAPVLAWLKQASESQIERFRERVREGRIAFGGMYCNLTPLYNIEQLSQSLLPLKVLREEFGAPITVAINHDVNGLPWPITQLLLDSGIDTLMMGVNIHSGGAPKPRPRGFWWEGSDGRRLLVFNAEHYQTFDRRMNLLEGTFEAMEQGVEVYLKRLEDRDYPYDFVYLSATHPVSPDNNSPNPLLMRLIKQWNDEGREPVIRFATPETIANRLREQPADTIDCHRGDWTDYWNFGCASSAHETRLYRRAGLRLAGTDLIRAGAPCPDDREDRRLEEAYYHLQFYGEHTWGADRGVTHPHLDGVSAQWSHKSDYAYRAWSLSGMLLRDGLDRLAGTQVSGERMKSLLFFNAAPVARTVYARIPKNYLEGKWTYFPMSVQRLDVDAEVLDEENSAIVGPIDLPALGYRTIPFGELKLAEEAEGLKATNDTIESPFHQISFDPDTGRVLEVFDKRLNRDVLDADSPWSFFGPIHESVDPEKHPLTSPWLGRECFFDYDWEPLWNDESGWKKDWPALRRGPNRLVSREVERSVESVALVLRWEMEGVDDLEQRIKLFAHREAIELSASFYKKDVRTPESIYFAFPLRFGSWRAHFDTAGLPVELDAEQIPGCCRDWVTVDRWVSVSDDESCVHLTCLDAPLVQVGDFNFGKDQRSVERGSNPLLLSWATNNYWNTNFRASQPGFLKFRYELRTSDRFDPRRAMLNGMESTIPVEYHPAIESGEGKSESLLIVDGEGVVFLSAKQAGSEGSVVRILNTNDTETRATIEFPGRPIREACRINALEEKLEVLNPAGGILDIFLPARSITSALIRF